MTFLISCSITACIVREWLCYTRRRLLLALWDAATAVGKSFVSSSGGLGNGPRVTGFDLADHVGQHIFFCRQNLVAACGRIRGRGMDRPQFTLRSSSWELCSSRRSSGLGYIVWKYRETPSSPPVAYSHGNTTLEIVWTVLTTILFVGLNLMGSSVWASQRFDPAEAGAVQVEVTGMQFAWYFRYPGPDGKYGEDESEV